jgi:acetylglutamate kinase
MKEVLIIKIGGNIIDDKQALKKFISDFASISQPKILVHGGGKLATRLSEKLGLKTQMINGRRVTDAETLQVVTMVYAGWINKSIAALLNAGKCSSVGLCGADAFLIPAAKRKAAEIDYGFAGDIVEERINIAPISDLIEKGIAPVIAPITSDEHGQLLNTNADTIASSLATALSKFYKVRLIFGFEKDGVLHDEKVIRAIQPAFYSELKKKNIVSDGMIPKLDNAFTALEKGVNEVIIGNAGKINEMLNANAGTKISL